MTSTRRVARVVRTPPLTQGFVGPGHLMTPVIGGGDFPSTDPFIKAWRLSVVRDRAGDFMFLPKPMWIVRASTGTTHGTPYDYDQRVPLILYGARVKPGRYASAASPAGSASRRSSTSSRARMPSESRPR